MNPNQQFPQQNPMGTPGNYPMPNQQYNQQQMYQQQGGPGGFQQQMPQRYPYPQGEGSGGYQGVPQQQMASGYQNVAMKQEPHWGTEGGRTAPSVPYHGGYPQQQYQMGGPQPPLHHMEQYQQNPMQQAMQEQQMLQQQQQMQQQQHLMQQQQQQQQQFQQQQQQIQQPQPPQPQQPQQQLTVPQVPFPPSTSSNQSGSTAQKESRPNREPTPKTVPSELARDLTKFQHGELLVLGKELVSELTIKTSTLVSVLKRVMERRHLNTGEDPQGLADQCRFILEKLVEIRLIVEKNRKSDWKRMTVDDYLSLVMDESELADSPEIATNKKWAEEKVKIKNKGVQPDGMLWYKGRWIPEHLEKKYRIFEANRRELVKLSNGLKFLDWSIDVSNPSHLKKVDKTKFSKRPAEH